MNDDEYEIHAIKYAWLSRRSPDNFIGGDPHDQDMPLDYFVWTITNASRTVVVDTGFGEEAAARRGRTILHPVAEGLQALERNKPRHFPHLKTAAAAFVIAAVPMFLMRLALNSRPRR